MTLFSIAYIYVYVYAISMRKAAGKKPEKLHQPPDRLSSLKRN